LTCPLVRGAFAERPDLVAGHDAQPVATIEKSS